MEWALIFNKTTLKTIIFATWGYQFLRDLFFVYSEFLLSVSLSFYTFRYFMKCSVIFSVAHEI